MVGLAFTVFLALILLACEVRWQDVYRKSATFLLCWNFCVTLFLVGIWFYGSLSLAGLGGWLLGSIGFVAFLTGGLFAFSVLLLFMIAMSVVQTIGALFLAYALEAEAGGVYRWRYLSLVTGVVLFVVGSSRIFG